jgi:hypothetical protein
MLEHPLLLRQVCIQGEDKGKDNLNMLVEHTGKAVRIQIISIVIGPARAMIFC